MSQSDEHNRRAEAMDQQGPDPWQAAQEVVDALVSAGLLGRDPVTRAEVVVVVESQIRRILGVGQ